MEGRGEGNLYTRYGLNPTIQALAKRLTDLENGSLSFCSGMAAEAATFFAHAHAGGHIVCIGDVYGGTSELLSANPPEVGIETTFPPADEARELESTLTESAQALFDWLDAPEERAASLSNLCSQNRYVQNFEEALKESMGYRLLLWTSMFWAAWGGHGPTEPARESGGAADVENAPSVKALTFGESGWVLKELSDGLPDDVSASSRERGQTWSIEEIAGMLEP